MTDLPPALRLEIEAVEDTYLEMDLDSRSELSHQSWLAARAALCAKVRRLCITGHIEGQEYAMMAPDSNEAERFTDALLNEADDAKS